MRFNVRTQHIFLYGLGLASTKVISFLLLPIVTRILSPAEYGTMEVMLTFLGLLATGANFGLSSAIFRFGGTAKTPREVDKICRNATTQALIIGCIVCLPIIVFSSQVADLLPGNVTQMQIIYLVLALILTNASTVQMDWLRLKDDVTTYVSVSIVFSLLQAVLVFLTLKAGYAVTGMLFSMFLSGLIGFFYFIFFMFKGRLAFDVAWQKKLFWYGLPLVFSGFADLLVQSVNWWIAYFDGTAELAIFAIAMKFSMVTMLLMQPISMWWLPNRYKQLDTTAGRIYTGKVTEMGTVLGFLICFGVALLGCVLIIILTPESYHKSIKYVPWLCLMYGLRNAGDMMNIGLYLNKTTYPMWINTVMAIFAVTGFYFFIPRWHAWGAIIVLNIIYFFRWIFCAWLSQKLVYLPYRYLQLVIFTSALMASVFSFELISMSSIYDYIIKGGCLGLLLVLITYCLGFLPKFLVLKV